MAIQSRSRPPTSLSAGISSTYCRPTVKTTRRTTAAPAPRMMPQTRCRRGRARQASAMTTALSPESRMLIQMILRTWIPIGP